MGLGVFLVFTTFHSLKPIFMFLTSFLREKNPRETVPLKSAGHMIASQTLEMRNGRLGKWNS